MPPATPSPSHSNTLLLLDLPPSLFCGIDLLTFTTPRTRTFHGLKHIPPGFHFFFTSETASLSIRTGFWFYIPNTTAVAGGVAVPSLIVRRWSSESNSLEVVPEEEGGQADGHGHEHWNAVVASVWERGLSPYRQSATNSNNDTEAEAGEGGEGAVDWAQLTAHINPHILTHLLQQDTRQWEISTSSSMLRDRDHIPGLTPEELTAGGWEERELGGLGIDLKRTWRAGAMGRERTEGARDASWALGDVVERFSEENGLWGGVLLGQMEVCFLMVLTVANYSCLEEWKRCVGLALGCKRAVGEREAFFEAFLGMLRRQIERGEDVEGGLFDMSDEGGGLLKGWLRGFKRTVGQVFVADAEGLGVKRRLDELESALREMYGWELGDEFARKGMVQLEDGEMVEMEVNYMHGEDEDGEYAPVVVDLENT